MKRLLRCLLLALLAAAGGAARADESFPSRTIRVIVVFAPGGGADTTSRLMAGPMGEFLGRGVVVENRPGGPYGGQMAAVARPDGYTLMADASAFAVRHKLHRNLSFSYEHGFEPVARLSVMPLLLVVPPTERAANLQDFIAALRARTDRPHYSVAGMGSASHFAGLHFVQRAGVDAQHVAYRGGSQGAMAVLTGETAFNFGTMPSALGLVQGGRLRALAVSSEARTRVAPDIPTVAEAGLPGFSLTEWIGLYAPAGTPGPVLDRISAAVRHALSHPDVVARLGDQGAEPAYLGRDEFGRFLDAQRKLLGALADAAGMQPE